LTGRKFLTFVDSFYLVTFKHSWWGNWKNCPYHCKDSSDCM